MIYDDERGKEWKIMRKKKSRKGAIMSPASSSQPEKTQEESQNKRRKTKDEGTRPLSYHPRYTLFSVVPGSPRLQSKPVLVVCLLPSDLRACSHHSPSPLRGIQWPDALFVW